MGVLDRIVAFFKKQPEELPEPEEPRIFVIADCHFNHRNIIKFTGRPYRTVSGMNRSIIQKWNATVRPQDTIYHVGDFARDHIGYFINRLQGRKFFITGNHDENLRHTKDWAIIEYKGLKFLLIHRPQDRPANWEGWTIHGHVHNASWDKFPYIDRTTQKVNVSVEMIGFRPVSLHRIVETIGFMEQYGHEVMPTRKHATWLRTKAMG